MNLVEVLAGQSRIRPHAVAIIEKDGETGRTVTFSELEAQSARVAALLKLNGIGKGEPVLVFQPMSITLYAVLLGIFRLGAVAMFLDPSAGRSHIDRCCRMLAPKGLIATPKAHLLRLVSSALRGIPRKFTTGLGLPGTVSLNQSASHSSPGAIVECDPDTSALVTFTSGSTGQPKAAVRTHGFLLAQHRVLERNIDLVPGEVDLTTLPVFLLANLASGVTSVIPNTDLRSPGAINPEPVLSQIAQHRVTRCAASPAFFERLLSKDEYSRQALGGMEKIFTGGAPVFPRLLERLALCAPGAMVSAVYGSTEAEPIAHVMQSEISKEDRNTMRNGGGLIAGRAVPEIRLAIIKETWGKPIGSLGTGDFDQIRRDAGIAGEIVVAGDHVLKSYLHDLGNEETKFSVDGQVWHRTGDAGRLDDRGRLWLLGRCVAKLKDDRGELYPFAVECVAMEHEHIQRAACLTHRRKRLLIVECAGGFSESERKELLNELAWASVDEIRTVKHIPVDKRHNAKIDYPLLRKMLGEG